MSANNTQQDVDHESIGMGMANKGMDFLEANHPEWYATYNDVLPDSLATRAELGELWATAPTEFACALIYAKFTSRLEIAAHTGLAFV